MRFSTNIQRLLKPQAFVQIKTCIRGGGNNLSEKKPPIRRAAAAVKRNKVT